MFANTHVVEAGAFFELEIYRNTIYLAMPRRPNGDPEAHVSGDFADDIRLPQLSGAAPARRLQRGPPHGAPVLDGVGGRLGRRGRRLGASSPDSGLHQPVLVWSPLFR